MRVDRDETVVAAICPPEDRPPLAIDDEGNERRFTLPEGGHRAQKGRKALKRFRSSIWFSGETTALVAAALMAAPLPSIAWVLVSVATSSTEMPPPAAGTSPATTGLVRGL